MNDTDYRQPLLPPESSKNWVTRLKNKYESVRQWFDDDMHTLHERVCLIPERVDLMHEITK